MKPLIIPFVVKAYLVNDTYAGTYRAPRWSPDYTQIYSSALGATITPPPFAEYADCLKAGAHLHFILPDAFTHGLVKDGEYQFPVVPNRYIVTRMYAASGKINTKTIVVESDYLQSSVSAPEDFTVIPYLDGSDHPYRFLGRWYEADNAPVQGEYLPKLTALGGGDPMFAAYYPTCRSVFGWYDDLVVDKVPFPCDLTYFVVGYFSNDAGNPFANVKNDEDFEAVLSANGFTADGGSWSDSCVLFGEALNIRWQGANFQYDDMEAPVGTVDVSFGNTSVEAMSAVLAQKTLKDVVKEDDLEYRLIELQYDLLKQSGEIDGNFKIDDEIHKHAFRGVDPLEEYDELQLTDKTAADGASDFSSYRELRRMQRDAGRRDRILRFTREKLYYAWEQYIQMRESYNDAQKELDAVIDLLANVSNMIAAKNSEDQAMENQRKLTLATLPKGYALKTQTAGAFFLPKEPVIMLSGDGVRRSFLFGEDTKNGLLYCQMSPQTSDAVSKETVTTACSEILEAAFPFDYSALLYQSALNSPALMKLFGKYTVKGAISPLAVNDSPCELAQLFMDWSADYYYTDDKATLDGWIFDYGDSNYVFNGTLSGQRAAIGGRVPLTPHALYTLTEQLNNYSKDFPNVYDKVLNLPFISQGLSGFTNELAGLRQVFQLPVEYAEDANATKVSEYALEERLSVSGSELYPMRGGYIALAKLTLVGTFGQKQAIVENSVYSKAAAYFPYAMPVSRDRTMGLFPLAFSSPVRLTAEFVGVADDTAVSTAAPDSSPVCALVLPELLNNRLILYTGNGEYAGILKTVYRNSARETLYIAPRDTPKLNDYLRGFIGGVTKNPGALPGLIELIQDTLDKTVHTCESDFIWGVPLVLARLGVGLEFSGGAEYSKKREDFEKYDDKGAGALKVPLKFGNVKRVTDGTVGVFDDSENFTKFHALWGADEKRYNGYVTTESVAICARDNERYFTALLVPNSDLHIETGVLPVVKTRINAAHTALADKLIPAAEINPVVADVDNVRLPVASGGFKWRYMRTPQDAVTADILPPADLMSPNTAVTDGFLIKAAAG